MPNVALVSVMHDPYGTLLAAMRDAFPRLLSAHTASYIVISRSTSREVERDLLAFGVAVEREPRPGVGASRRQSLAMALRDGQRWLHYCDLDRALHWARHFPDEMVGVLDEIPASDLLVLGRTPRAFATHPECMIETERLANRAFALAFGRRWDLCSAARGLSARAAAEIVARSRVRGVGTEGEWPALLLPVPSFSVAYTEVEGMEYETADRYPREVLAAGGVAAWTARESLLPASWARRLAFAWAIAEACLHPGEPGQVDIV